MRVVGFSVDGYFIFTYEWFQTTTSTSTTSLASKNHPKKTCTNQTKLSKTIKLSLALTTKTVKALANGTD